MQQNIVSAHIYKAWLSWKIPRTFHRCRTQTLYGTVNVQGGPLSVISSVLYTGGPGCGWHSCGRGVKVRPVLCFAFMNDAACDSLLSVSACGCLLHGWTFFFSFPWALSFFPLRSVSCMGLLRVDSGINTWCTNDPTYTHLTLLQEKLGVTLSLHTLPPSLSYL